MTQRRVRPRYLLVFPSRARRSLCKRRHECRHKVSDAADSGKSSTTTDTDA